MGTTNFDTVSVTGTVQVNGTNVVGTRQSAVVFTNATTNATPHITNMSNAIYQIVAVLNSHGLTG